MRWLECGLRDVSYAPVRPEAARGSTSGRPSRATAQRIERIARAYVSSAARGSGVRNALRPSAASDGNHSGGRRPNICGSPAPQSSSSGLAPPVAPRRSAARAGCDTNSRYCPASGECERPPGEAPHVRIGWVRRGARQHWLVRTRATFPGRSRTSERRVGEMERARARDAPARTSVRLGCSGGHEHVRPQWRARLWRDVPDGGWRARRRRHDVARPSDRHPRVACSQGAQIAPAVEAQRSPTQGAQCGRELRLADPFRIACRECAREREAARCVRAHGEGASSRGSRHEVSARTRGVARVCSGEAVDTPGDLPSASAAAARAYAHSSRGAPGNATRPLSEGESRSAHVDGGLPPGRPMRRSLSLR